VEIPEVDRRGEWSLKRKQSRIIDPAIHFAAVGLCRREDREASPQQGKSTGADLQPLDRTVVSGRSRMPMVTSESASPGGKESPIFPIEKTNWGYRA